VLKGHVNFVDNQAGAQDWFAADVKLYKTVVTIDEPGAGLKPGMSAEVTILAQQTTGPVLNVPVQAVLAAGKGRFCFVLNDNDVQVREVTLGMIGDRGVEIRSGLEEGDRVLLSPRALLQRLTPFLGKGTGPSAGKGRPSPTAQNSILVESVKPVQDDAASRKRAWIDQYGLTAQDLDHIAALPTVRDAVPVRRIPQEARRLDRTDMVNIVGTLPAFAELKRIRMAEGRFLGDEDGLQRRNVVVLGADAAETLFPLDDPIGETVILQKQLYVVVGVLEREGDEVRGGEGWLVNHSVYLPLPTCNARFGQRVFVTRGGSRGAEAVALHSILLTVADRGEVSGTIEAIRDILEQSHTQKDWAVKRGGE
jgi:hypothetical protein